MVAQPFDLVGLVRFRGSQSQSSPPNSWGKVSEENGGGEERMESEMGGGKKKGRLWHRNKLTYFLVAAYPCSENEQSCRIRILNRSLVVSRIESRS